MRTFLKEIFKKECTVRRESKEYLIQSGKCTNAKTSQSEVTNKKLRYIGNIPVYINNRNECKEIKLSFYNEGGIKKLYSAVSGDKRHLHHEKMQ